MSPFVRFWPKYSQTTHFSMEFSRNNYKFPFRYQELLSVSDPVNLLASTDQPAGYLNLTLSCLAWTVPGASWVLHVPGDGTAWVEEQKSYSSLLVHIGGSSVHSCGGGVGAGCCRCYGKCPSSDTAGLGIHPGYYDRWGYQRRSKAVPLPVLWKRWLHAGAELRGQHPSESALQSSLPLQTEVLPATHHPDFRLPWRDLERQLPPLHRLLTYQLLHLCSNPCAQHLLSSGSGGEIAPEYTSLGTFLGLCRHNLPHSPLFDKIY